MTRKRNGNRHNHRTETIEEPGTEAPSGTQSNHAAERKSRFLAAIQLGVSVAEAARWVGIPRTTLYRWRRNDPEFAWAWDNPKEQNPMVRSLEFEAFKRALNGNDRLLVFLLSPTTPTCSASVAGTNCSPRRPDRSVAPPSSPLFFNAEERKSPLQQSTRLPVPVSPSPTPHRQLTPWKTLTIYRKPAPFWNPSPCWKNPMPCPARKPATWHSHVPPGAPHFISEMEPNGTDGTHSSYKSFRPSYGSCAIRAAIRIWKPHLWDWNEPPVAHRLHPTPTRLTPSTTLPSILSHTTPSTSGG